MPACRSAGIAARAAIEQDDCGSRFGKKGQISPLLTVEARRRLALISIPTRLNRLRDRWPLHAHVTPITCPPAPAAAVCLVSRTRLWRRGGGEPRASERRGGAD